ncbi:MAG TPA: hypothetical protein PLB62_13460, partial [Candidatus Sumerlaeota bacterium]|nr:hypothetical protein [Candidatus Sumerlaeota bacterium]
MKTDKTKFPVKIIIPAALVAIALLIILLPSRPADTTTLEKPDRAPEKPSIENSERNTGNLLNPAPSPTTAPALIETGALPEDDEIELPASGMDPELQPRTYTTWDFRGLAELPDGFKMTNLELTVDGIRLLDAKPGEENEPRSGILESPPEVFDFPSNAVAPLWVEDLPEGTDMFVEVCVSPDGENWGVWHWIEPDEHGMGQISPTYPDGSPNPHYGYMPGNNLAWGNRQWQHVRYRVTLYADAEEKKNPTLGAFRLYYQDSTLEDRH